MFIKIGLRDLPPISFAGIRFVIAAAILLALIRFRRTPLPDNIRDWSLLAVTGVLAFSLNYGLVFWGEQFISSGLAAVLQAMIPAFGLVFAHFYLPTERLTLAKLAGVMMGVIGVAIVFSNELTVAGPRALAGSVALVLSSLVVSFSNVLVKAKGKNLNPGIIAAGQMLFGLVPLLFVGIVFEGNPLTFHWTKMAVLALFYLAIVGSVIAFHLYYWLLQNMEVTKSMLIALVTPVVAVTLGMLILDEHLTWRTLAGGATIIFGIALIVLSPRKSKKVTVKIGSTIG